MLVGSGSEFQRVKFHAVLVFAEVVHVTLCRALNGSFACHGSGTIWQTANGWYAFVWKKDSVAEIMFSSFQGPFDSIRRLGVERERC